jgi:hypothetical protein
MVCDLELFIPEQPLLLTIEVIFERDRLHIVATETDKVMPVPPAQLERTPPAGKSYLADDSRFLEKT